MATNYRIGQIVEIRSPINGSDVQKGDLGTVTRTPYRFSGEWWIDVLWHRLEEERFMLPSMIRLYDDPMDKLNQSAGAGETIRALSTVINATLPHALEDVTRDLERACMEREDIRAFSWSVKLRCFERALKELWREEGREDDDEEEGGG